MNLIEYTNSAGSPESSVTNCNFSDINTEGEEGPYFQIRPLEDGTGLVLIMNKVTVIPRDSFFVANPTAWKVIKQSLKYLWRAVKI